MTPRALTLAQSETKAFRQMLILSALVHVLVVAGFGWRNYQTRVSRIDLNAATPMNVMWARTVQMPKATPSYKLPGPRVMAKPEVKAAKAPSPKVVLSKPETKSKAEIRKEKEESEAKAREKAMENALAALSSDLKAEPTPRPDNFPSTGDGKDAYAGGPTGGVAGMLGGSPVFGRYKAEITNILMNNLIWLQPPPPLATIEIRIDDQGNILDPTLVASSGNSSFDSAALRAVRKSNPLPAPPPELAQDIAGEPFYINFDLNKR